MAGGESLLEQLPPDAAGRRDDREFHLVSPQRFAVIEVTDREEQT